LPARPPVSGGRYLPQAVTVAVWGTHQPRSSNKQQQQRAAAAAAKAKSASAS
jgi:hypothetical protein